MADSPGEAFLHYVQSDLGVEWQRKTGIETKALAILTANLGLVTLYFALRTQLRLVAISQGSFAAASLLIALFASLGSIVAAALTVIPGRYPTSSHATLSELQEYIDSHPTYTEERVVKNILRARLSDLKAADKTNSSKAKILATAFAALAISIAFLAISLVASSSAGDSPSTPSITATVS